MNSINLTIIRHPQRPLVPTIWLVISLLVFTACLGRGNEAVTTGADTLFVEGTPGTLVCTDVCAQRAQCGRRVDGAGDVVLAGSGGPLVSNHELFFPNNTAILIAGEVLRSLQPVNAGEPFTTSFYYVTATDGSNKGGWVAGWCVQAVTP